MGEGNEVGVGDASGEETGDALGSGDATGLALAPAVGDGLVDSDGFWLKGLASGSVEGATGGGTCPRLPSSRAGAPSEQ